MIKIGGGSITDPSVPRKALRGEISRLLAEIYDAQKEEGFDVIIGHGSGSFGHVTAHEYSVAEGLINDRSVKGALLTKVVASELNFIVIDEAVKLGMPVFPFFPSSFAFAENRRLSGGFVDHIRVALEKGFIPIVHGDVVIDTKQGVCIASTEEVLRFISERIPPKMIVLATDVDGVYDKDPNSAKGAKLISLVNSSNIGKVVSMAGGAKKIDVTGGMRTKISILYSIVKRTGATGYIANATKPGVINKTLVGRNTSCTIIKP